MPNNTVPIIKIALKMDFHDNLLPPPSAYAMALLSYHAYSENPSFPHIQSLNERLAESYVLKEHFVSGPISIIFSSNDGKCHPRAILAIAKSGPIPVTPDAVMDVQSLFERTQELVETITQKYPDYTYFICGHYLGGILAQNIAQQLLAGGASFGAPGIYTFINSFIPSGNDYPKFYNHVMKPNDDEYLDKPFFNPLEYYGQMIEHFPFHQQHLWYSGGGGGPHYQGEQADQNYFFYFPHFIDFHFSEGKGGKLEIYKSDIEFNDFPCFHYCCHSIEKRKKQIDINKNNDWWSFTILGTIWGTFLGGLGLGTFFNWREKREKEGRRLEEERRQQEGGQ